MSNYVDPNQPHSSESDWSGFTPFTKYNLPLKRQEKNASEIAVYWSCLLQIIA